MKGLVYRIDDEVYLSLIDNEKPSDGIPISEGTYTTLQDNQISLVDVNIKDGTKIVEDIDINYFVYNEAQQNRENLFYEILDISLFTFKVPIKEIVEFDGFNGVTKDILNYKNV